MDLEFFNVFFPGKFLFTLCLCVLLFYLSIRVLFLNIMSLLLGSIQHLSSFLLVYTQYSLKACKITIALGLYQHLTKHFFSETNKMDLLNIYFESMVLKIKYKFIVKHQAKTKQNKTPFLVCF